MKSIKEYNFTISFPVHWGEMDAFGHVNNIQFLKYHETARISFFKKIGFNTDHNTSIAPILAHISCQYIQPITYPDEVTVGTKVNKIGNTSFVMEFSIFTQNKGLVAKGETVIVCFNYQTQQKTVIPDDLRKALEEH